MFAVQAELHRTSSVEPVPPNTEVARIVQFVRQGTGFPPIHWILESHTDPLLSIENLEAFKWRFKRRVQNLPVRPIQPLGAVGYLGFT